MKKWLGYLVVGGVLFCAAYFGLWSLERWVNYKIGYESMVASQIREMVKKECLR